MTLMKLDDFKCRPSVYEYLALYISSSTCIIVSAASIFGNLGYQWAALTFLTFIVCATISNVLNLTRTKRAEGFYVEWLSALSKKEIKELRYRLRDDCDELRIMRKTLK